VSVYESAGVVVGVATEVVNIGDKSPEEKLVTVPLPPLAGISFAVSLRNVGKPGDPSGLAYTRFDPCPMGIKLNAGWL
jgi:hypothetical protein